MRTESSHIGTHSIQTEDGAESARTRRTTQKRSSVSPFPLLSSEHETSSPLQPRLLELLLRRLLLLRLLPLRLLLLLLLLLLLPRLLWTEGHSQKQKPPQLPTYRIKKRVPQATGRALCHQLPSSSTFRATTPLVFLKHPWYTTLHTLR